MTPTQKLEKIKEVCEMPAKDHGGARVAILAKAILDIINQQPEPQRVPFSWEQFQTGRFICICDTGREVEQLKRFEGTIKPYVGIEKGESCVSEFHEFSLFLIPIEQEPESFYFNAMHFPNGCSTIESCEEIRQEGALAVVKQSLWADGTLSFEVVKMYDKN